MIDSTFINFPFYFIFSVLLVSVVDVGFKIYDSRGLSSSRRLLF